ncbi:DUF1559 family PulG-like putative transporter [Bremerella alba]|uniref:DUF1559 domain-containing protein n=1 Tax=Bremerella alba TaxID=980252 RepID=A0A7V8V974_9BACT|nr:DUF1559 domain-containing protein [Bremerella alba]MBA2117210.1 hypothetical protein [Bremerella alba]
MIWANSTRLASFIFVAVLCFAVTGCGGCGGDSPASKLAKFKLSRGNNEPKPAPAKKPVEKPAPASPAEKKSPAATPTPESKPAATTAPTPEAKPAEQPTAPPTETVATLPETPANQIAGARDRFAILEGFKLQPVQGERAQTKARSKAVLHILGKALAQQIADNSTIPASAPTDKQGRQLLSWRVHLLPYLGYADLYSKFNLEEAWDSPHNIKLAAEKPYAFMTPEINDDRTNFVLLTGPTCAAQERRANPLSALSPRGLHNSVVVVEVANPANRVVWTKPADLPFDPSEPSQGIAGWADNHFCAITGDGVVHDFPVISNDHLNRLFVVSNPIQLSEVASSSPQIQPQGTSNTNATSEISMTSTEPLAAPISRNDFDPTKLPLPSHVEIDSAALELRRLFQSEAREADQDKKKEEIAKKLLQHAEYLQNDPAKQCAALQIAYRFAILAKNPVLLKNAFDKLQERFQVDSFSSDLYTVRFGAENLQKIPAHELPEFRAVAKSILERAEQENNFQAMDELIQIGTRFAASQSDQKNLAELEQLKERLKASRKAYDSIQARFLSLQVPSLDEEGNLMVGKFWCVHRNQWDKGFEFLLRGNDVRFEHLAETERTSPIDPRIQFKIAEGWWDIGISSPPGAERNKFLGRAAQWYKKADSNMQDSIEKVTSQQRLQEFARLTGVKEIPAMN